MLKPDVTNFNRYQRGREAASKEMDHLDFDVNVAIESFKFPRFKYHVLFLLEDFVTDCDWYFDCCYSEVTYQAYAPSLCCWEAICFVRP